MKKVLITGASKGIGFALTKKFLAHHYKVYATYYRTDTFLGELKASSSAKHNLYPIKVDLSKTAEIDYLFTQIKEPLDVLINNAGISEWNLFDKISETEWDDLMAVNLKAYFLCAQKAFPGMLSQKSGSIINLSSIWGITGAAMEVHYSTAKAGIIGFTKSLAKELAPSNILVNAIAPGVIDTDMLAVFSEEELTDLKQEIPLGRFGQPEEVAELALFLAEQKYITGEVININGGFHI